jgi:hypothetical protein
MKNSHIINSMVFILSAACLSGCQSTSNDTKAVQQLKKINKALLSTNSHSRYATNSDSRYDAPNITVSRTSNFITTKSTSCGVNNLASDSSKISFQWNRYCSQLGGEFKKGDCSNDASEVLFHTETTIDRTCLVGSNDSIKRVLVIIEPIGSLTNPSYLESIGKRHY